jgi:transposase-like protein
MKPAECTNCGEKNRITRIGFISVRGYLCESCHVFYDTNGKARRVIKIEGSTNNKITFEQLIFEKKRKRKAIGK